MPSLSSQEGSANSSKGGDRHQLDQETTIDELAAAYFVDDIRRAMSVFGCTPQCVEDWRICEPIDAVHDFVTAGPCFEPIQSRDRSGMMLDTTKTAIPTKIEVMFDGENDTVMSASFTSDTIYSGSTYESFRGFAEPRGHCGQTAFLTKCTSKCLAPPNDEN